MPPTRVPPRSRSGCSTCRQRHRKCDEQRPTCGPCRDRRYNCDYRLNLRWANACSIASIETSIRGPSHHGKSKPIGQTIAPITANENNDSDGNVRPVSQVGSDEKAKGPSPCFAQDASRTTTADAHPSLEQGDVELSASFSYIWPRPDIPPVAMPHALPFDADLSHIAAPARSDHGRRSSPARLGDQETNNAPPGEFGPISRASSQLRSDAGDGDSVSSGPNEWVIDTTFGGLHYQIFQSQGEQMAFSYFISRVAVLMVAYNDGHNPFQTLAFLSLSYPMLLHSILSVATGHLYNCGRCSASILSSRQSRALHSLQAALSLLMDSKAPNEARMSPSSRPAPTAPGLLEDGWGIFSTLNAREVALATIMMQMSSTFATGMGSVEVHLKCAYHFLMDLDYVDRPPHSMFARLFVHRFALGDIVLAFLRFRRPIAPPHFYMYRTDTDVEQLQPSFYEIHGCSPRVLCFLAEISVLSADLVEGRSTQDEIQAKAFDLEMQMRTWGLKYYVSLRDHNMSNTTSANNTSNANNTNNSNNNKTTNDTNDTNNANKKDKTNYTNQNTVRPPLSASQQSQIGTLAEQRAQLDIVGECFFWTAQLLLMRRVFFDSTESARVQFIRRQLFHLIETLPPGCGPDTFIPFPFYMAAREAITLEDRDWVRRRHVDAAEVYRDRSREYIMASTEKIWENINLTTEPSTYSMRPWDTPRERFIRDMDSGSTFFMY